MNEQLPERCECGGKMLYSQGVGYLGSCCDRCTPVVVVRLPIPARPPDGGRASNVE
jgi:hypothetical protein